MIYKEEVGDFSREKEKMKTQKSPTTNKKENL